MLMILSKTPIDNNGHDQIQRWKRPLQRLKGKRVNISLLIDYQFWELYHCITNFYNEAMKIVPITAPNMTP